MPNLARRPIVTDPDTALAPLGLNADTLAHHLEVAALRYRDNAESIANSRVAAQFAWQAAQTQAMANSLRQGEAYDEQETRRAHERAKV